MVHRRKEEESNLSRGFCPDHNAFQACPAPGGFTFQIHSCYVLGMKRSKSADRLRLLLAQPRERQPTLLPCPACDSSGRILKEGPKGRYLLHICRWCDGIGAVDTKIQWIWCRWLRIAAAKEKP